ncbi:purine-nucleoside phosphorylase [Cellvibrio japonicus]|uniref:Putative purine nucleoside permease n=1 Tax=Cellvibrio japonicus (strain Ueda107) TaxID=498211 RepID=B3PJH8_CELJU|nr:purine nucleoside permease [Cellvibrio japonicus]ACE82639.1 putative purine nucleoside permease [Cellvibrio japonicus Ueda107]QEI11265.1 purine nucleoside permease [Cellvibrio japonicus]QEI14839.1 purine nucleoside permease [Cellvibrio japonicus]QEI18419.1 purine nucleoside permease [Cellvibrio japonicus]
MLNLIGSALLVLASLVVALNAQAAIPVKVVVVSMFEHGEVRGDQPGEYQLWIERQKLDNTFPFPLGLYDLHMNDTGLLAICTGGGVTNATASIMALGMDPRFDLSKAYWIIAGIGGGDPLDVSLGTGVWAKHVVDGDLLYEIDGREIPKDWQYGLIPLGAKKPNQESTGWTVDTIHYALNPGLVNWAYQLTKDHPVADTPAMKAFREQYTGYPQALRPPFVTIGDTIGSSTYWHGWKLNEWANDWMHLHAGKDSNFMTTNMEDNGTLTALHRMAKLGRVDTQRILVLRTVSNFSAPPPGKTAAWSTTAPYPDKGLPAIEAAYALGNRVAQALINDWKAYEKTIPSAK